MAKIALDDIKSGFSLDKVNANFKKIQDALNTKVLYRDNPYGEVNVMQNTLDMNGHRIINVSGITGGGGGGGDGGPATASELPFVPTATISATDVQAAIVEVASEVPTAAINLPRANGPIAQLGSSMRYAREDHVHEGTGGGGGGGTAISNGQVYAYQRSLTAPLGSPGEVTFTFATATITAPSGNALANGWSKTIPEGTAPLYVTVASASSITGTDIIAANEWSAPVVLASNGANGLNGLNVATVYLYRRTVSNVAPPLPSANVNWQFNPPQATGITNGWSQFIPDSLGGAYLWVTTATAVSNTTTDIITATEWAVPQKLAQDGTPGTSGPSGADGQRGNVNLAGGGYSSWSDAAANSVISSAGFGVQRNRDIVTLYGPGFSQTRFYDNGSWIPMTAYINGNLLVSGTISGNTISGGTMTSTTVKYGSGHTATGYAFEITSSGAVWADNIIGGIMRGDNSYYGDSASVYGATTNGSPRAGVEGLVAGTNSNSGTAGVYGHSAYNGTGGLVGPNLPYDFYAVGTGTNYGPFTGAHDALSKDETFVLGDIVRDVKEVSRSGISNAIFHVTKTTTANEKGVVGVVASKAKPLDYVASAFVASHDQYGMPIPNADYAAASMTYNIMAMNAVGEGLINVCGEGGDIEPGDLIVASNTPGKGMKQADDVVRGYTVAKARAVVKFSSPNEVKQIACIYLCG